MRKNNSNANSALALALGTLNPHYRNTRLLALTTSHTSYKGPIDVDSYTKRLYLNGV